MDWQWNCIFKILNCSIIWLDSNRPVTVIIANRSYFISDEINNVFHVFQLHHIKDAHSTELQYGLYFTLNV